MIHEIENDIIQEAINIGIGEAASVLSELLNARVTIRIPEIRVCNIADIPLYINGKAQEMGMFISQDFHGTLEGKAILTYSKKCSLSLINAIFREKREVLSLSNTDIASLQEIGNIIIVSFLAAISNVIEGMMTFSLPLVTVNLAGNYLNIMIKEMEKFEKCILFVNEMIIREQGIHGYIFVLLTFNDICIITERLKSKLC